MIDFDELERMNVFKPDILNPLIKWINFHAAGKQLPSDHFPMELYQKSNPTDYCKSNLYSMVQNLKSTEMLPESTIYTVAYLFMCINRFEDVLKRLCDRFFSVRRYRIFDNVGQIIVLLYIFIFRISTLNMREAGDFISHFGIKKLLSVVTYITRREVYETLRMAGLAVYDEAFVNEKLLWPYMYAIPLLKDLERLLRDELQVIKASSKKPNTVPVLMNVLNRPKQHPPVPPSTPEDVYKARRAGLIPKSTYEKLPVDDVLTAMKNFNKTMAENLLKEANKLAPRCAQPKKKWKEIIVADDKPVATVRKDAPVFKPVEVKLTATTILRECARIASDECKEVKKLKELESGGLDPRSVIKLEEEMRQREKEEEAIKVQEKRLTALLSREGAYIAKQTLLNEIKTKGDNVRKEMQELNEKLEEWKEIQRQEAHKIVEKCRSIEAASRQACATLTKEKRQKAAEVSEESQKLRAILMRQKDEEKKKKIQLIQEITAIQALRPTWVKDFDPTETSGSGLLCEISLAELKERLYWLKMKWAEDAESRKASIRQKREKQKNFIRSSQKALEAYKASKRVTATMATDNRTEHVSAPGIEALRKTLEERRALRLQK